MLQSNRFSGAENVVIQIISMLKNDNYEFVYSSQDGQIRDVLNEKGVRFSPIKEMSISEFRRVIREEKPDIIHAHDMKASLYAALVCGKTPFISHIHNNNFDSRGLSMKSMAYMIAAQKAKHIFWVSNSSYSGYIFHDFFKKKSSVLYNTIDADALKQKMSMDKNKYNYDVIYLGRLTYQKNPQRMIDVLCKFLQKCPEAKIAVIGAGDLESEIQELVKKRGIENQVDLFGYMTNPLKCLHDSKVMLMTSRWEGTPMCVLEAMALGVPIVSTPTDGIKDIVVNGETGYLSDNDDIMADHLAEIVLNNEQHQYFSRHTIEKFNEINNIESYKRNIEIQYSECI